LIRHLLALTGLGALVAIVVVFVTVTNRQGGDSGLPAGLPVAHAAPATTTSATTAVSATPAAPETATTSATTTSPASASAATTTGSSGTTTSDSRGYVDSLARCPEGETAAAFGRTQRSQVVICATGDGNYEYRGVRLSDNATLQSAAEATDGGFVARPEGATYTVTPDVLEVISGGKVIYRDTWIDYHRSSLAAERTGTSTTSPSTTSTTTTTTTTTDRTSATSTTATTTAGTTATTSVTAVPTTTGSAKATAPTRSDG
jgi:hypothetical protein